MVDVVGDDDDEYDDVPIISFPIDCVRCGARVEKPGKCPGGCGYSY